mmetsp:Transcript_45203/g.76141  ORF Transcript_45203/g.76141 Transcript_45203/m.76141 type:complete len:94 (+) Transcript_45203:812-1093(+)
MCNGLASLQWFFPKEWNLSPILYPPLLLSMVVKGAKMVALMQTVTTKVEEMRWSGSVCRFASLQHLLPPGNPSSPLQILLMVPQDLKRHELQG